MVNRVILIGNLGRDPEIRHLENGAAVAKFSIATNENYRDKSGEWQTLTEWHDIVLWRQLAERAEASLKKGSLVYVEGKLTHRTWQDQDGNNRKTTEVVANYFRQINRRDDNKMGQSGGYFPSTEDESHAYGSYQDQTSDDASTYNDGGSRQPANEVTDTSEAIDDDLPF